MSTMFFVCLVFFRALCIETVNTAVCTGGGPETPLTERLAPSRG